MNTGYREILRQKLAERCARNPQYSLRALARDIRWDVSHLSRVINGKQNLSPSSARMLAEELLDDSTEKELFIALVEFETARRPEVREVAASKIESLRVKDAIIPLQIEAFRVIADWYHTAIMDYTLLESADTSASAIATAFGLSELEARLAIDRLLGLGLLERRADRLVKTHVRLSLPSGSGQQSVRMFHKQMIGKALESIEGQQTEQRYLRAETLPLDPSDLPKIIEFIDQLGKKAQTASEKAKRPQSLYQLNIQFFDLLPQGRRKAPASPKKGVKS